MKLILFCILLTTNVFAKETVVLSVWRNMGVLKVTPGLINAGIELGLANAKNKIKIINVDTDGSFKNVTSKVKEAIEMHKPDLIVGAITSNMALFISSVAEKYKVPFFTPFATLPEVTKNKKYTYRLCWSDEQQANAIVNLISDDQKLKAGVAIFNGKESYSVGLKNLFVKSANEKGIKILRQFEFNEISDINESKIKELNNLKLDFVFLPTYQTEAASLIAKLAPSLKGKIKYFGGDSWGGGRLFHERVAKLKKPFTGFYTQHYSLDSKRKSNTLFKSKLSHSKILDRFVGVSKMSTTAMKAPIAVGYDLIGYIDSLIDQLKSQKLKEAIKLTKYEGASGTIQLGIDNNPIGKPLFIYEISRDGESFYRGIK